MEQIHHLHSIVRRRSVGASSVLQQPQTPVWRQTLRRHTVRDQVLRSRPLPRRRWVHQLEQLWIVHQVMRRRKPGTIKILHQPRPCTRRQSMRWTSHRGESLQHPELPNQRRLHQLEQLWLLQQDLRKGNTAPHPHLHKPHTTVRRSGLRRSCKGIQKLQSQGVPNRRRMDRFRKLRQMQQILRGRDQDQDPNLHQP